VFNIRRHGILLGEGAVHVYRAIGEFVQHLSPGEPSPLPPVKMENNLGKENEVS
jgi:hypothetical protein